MTQEQKAIAYDEAIKKMKGMKSSWVTLSYTCKTMFQDLEYIFPELKESEDERIRKDIISLVNEFWERIGSINPEYSSRSEMLAWLEKQGRVKESEIPQPIKETSKENDNSLTNKAWSEIQNGIILDGVVYELTTGFPDNKLSLCGNCELNEKCIDFGGTLCYFFADHFRKVFRKVKMERKL